MGSSERFETSEKILVKNEWSAWPCYILADGLYILAPTDNEGSVLSTVVTWKASSVLNQVMCCNALTNTPEYIPQALMPVRSLQTRSRSHKSEPWVLSCCTEALKYKGATHFYHQFQQNTNGKFKTEMDGLPLVWISCSAQFFTTNCNIISCMRSRQ